VQCDMYMYVYIYIYMSLGGKGLQYLSSGYCVIITLRASGLLVAHHQEVAMYICDSWYVLYVLVDCRRALMEWNSRLRLTSHTNCHI
jgi:hypothetical protein